MIEEESKPFKFPKQLIIIYLTVFADSFGYSFIMPILPYYTEYLKGTPFELGVLLSIYAFTQAFSCLIMGAGSDKFGRKLFIILSLLGSWTGPLLQSFTPTMLWFIIARGYTGLLAGSNTVAQAYVADIVPPSHHANYLSHIGAILSSAYVLGPAFGGLLAEISIQMPFWIAAAFALVVFIAAFWAVQETNKIIIKKSELKKEKKTLLKKTGLTNEESQRLTQINTEFENIKAEESERKKKSKEKIHWNTIMILALLIKFCNDCTSIVFDSVFLLFIKDEYNSSTMNNSILISTTGVVSMLCPLLLFPFLHDKSSILILCSSFMLAGFLMMTFVPLLWFAYISCNILFVGTSVVYNLPSVIVSAQAPASHQGQAIAMVTLMNQIAYVAMPLVSTYIYEYDKIQAVLMGVYFSALLLLLSIVLFFVHGGRTCENTVYSKDSSNDTKDIEEKKIQNEDDPTLQPSNSSENRSTVVVDIQEDPQPTVDQSATAIHNKETVPTSISVTN